MIEIESMPPGGTAARSAASPRLTERHVLALGLGITALFVVVTGVVAAHGVLTGGSTWAAIHLAMAGAATVAIGTFMPHFAVTLAGTRPARPMPRFATLVLLAVGAAGVVGGVSGAGRVVTAAGAVAMLVGIGLVAVQTFAPRRDPLARRHPVVSATYGGALAMLAAAVGLGTLGTLGVPVVATAWDRLRPAHAWLGLFGAVSLTIFATLVYLAPTILGARIRASAWLVVAVVGMLLGPPVAAAGFAVGAEPVVVTGVALTLTGAIAQLGYLFDVVRRRGPFTSEHDWRRVASWHLVAGTAWYALALLAALVGVIGGTSIRGWSIGALAIPAVAGWLLQELIGSWTHLAPSVTAGSPSDHARQRRHLAFASRTRLVALNGGVGLVWTGTAAGVGGLALVGAGLIGATGITSVAVLVRALLVRRS